jgi:hypothetical protein
LAPATASRAASSWAVMMAAFRCAIVGSEVPMAICSTCNQEMTKADGCTLRTITLDGVVHDRIPHGDGSAWGPAKARCSDCGVEPGKIHHPGCQYEQCPACGSSQMFACDCEKGEE